MSWYLYIIQCRDKTLYTGTTKDLKRRIYDHNRDKACRYTKCRAGKINPFRKTFH
ncbi:MAG: GIY-YIG nuclease family protein [Candidatus Ratteibacteria bacterium]|nr:GIY-YIG nuclease family protein [Candidatus Ratteibacteria bacterium]